MNSKERIVVVGGGFAGLNFLKHLDKSRYDIVLVDRNNFHSFPPLFYQIASSGLEPESICFPFRREMRKGKMKAIDFHLGEVKRIDMNKRELHTQYETLQFDRLVIAAGSTNNFFGNNDLIKKVFTLKSTSEAMRIRNEILDRLERACICKNEDEKRSLLNFVVIGGGATGVEIAGSLGEMKRYIIPREYPSLNGDEVKITLVEGSGAVLSAMSKCSQDKALTYLNELMVDVRLNVLMESYDEGLLKLNDGSTIQSNMVIWTAGVAGVGFEVDGGELPIGRGGRIEVDSFNRVKGFDGVYAIGDVCIMTTEAAPHGHPQLAQVAIQQGNNLAKNLNRLQFANPKEFVYKDKGTMATVGRNRAVADIKKTKLSGWLAWIAWMFVHLLSILGMRNKFFVLLNWIWGYFTYATSLRILVHTSRYPLRKRWQE